jgi:hypothetical protein
MSDFPDKDDDERAREASSPTIFCIDRRKKEVIVSFLDEERERASPKRSSSLLE